MNGLQEIVGNDRQHSIQFEVASLARKGDRCIIADHLRSRLDDGFRYHRIHLSWHEGRAGLKGRNIDFSQPTSGSG